jgi:two-component system OmpR family sensor kinase
MSIRLRLALWYSLLFTLVLFLVAVFSYAIHERGQYDDIDRILVVSAGHAAAEAATSTSSVRLVEERSNLEIALRLFSSGGVLLESTSDTNGLPSLDPRQALREPAGPAFDVVARLAPPLVAQAPTLPGGAFGLLTAQGQRWRVYVLPVHQAGGNVSGYIEAITPLGQVDALLQDFRLTLILLSAGGLLLALAGSWLVASRALRPIALLVQTAQTITLSHDLSRRVDAPPHQDELGRLAMTFNEMLRSIETAYQAEKRFVADASHELRAPLTAIQGNLDLLNRHPDMSEAERAESLTEVTREATRLARLVADLLALARADAGIVLNRCPLDLDAVILEAYRTARPLAHGQQFVLDPFEPAAVEGHEDRLKQLLVILLDNALKYTPAGGRVTLGLRRHDREVEIIVRDTGVGIAAQDLPHVFERFYRADPARSRDPGGTGLGLSIAQWIVEQHEGTITLESQPGEGTTVIVRMPMCLCPQ